MAKRPYFSIGKYRNSLYEEKIGVFKYSSGFAISQKKKNIRALHESILEEWPYAKILEVSTKSDDPLGVALSAFNLTWSINGRSFPVECIFQGCKVFSEGGPYKDIIFKTPLEAKRDSRLKESGNLVNFKFKNQIWPLTPTTGFYDFIYIQALKTHKNLCDEVLSYDTFTDIEFNPLKSINCQARSVAMFVTLSKFGLLDEVTQSQEKFLNLYQAQTEGEGLLF